MQLSRRQARLTRAVQLLLLVEVVLFVASTLPGVRADRFDALIDGWLQGSAYVVVAVLAGLRALVAGPDQRLWRLVAIALGLRAAAFVVYLAHVRTLDPIPYPSVADAGWLGMAVLLVAAMALYVRERFARLSTGMLLDGVIGALAVAAVAVTSLDETLERLTTAGTPADVLVTNVAYPVLDLLLVLVILGVLVATRWRPSPALWLFALGAVGFAVLDSVFLYEVTAGTWRPGTPVSGLSLAATAVMGYAGWIRRPRHERRRAESLPGLVLPTAFALTCLATMVHASVADAPLAAIVLATGGLLLSIARTGVGFRDLRAIAEVRREARTDELTGAANRRAFNETLERAVADPRLPAALLVLDLDNFKDVNDTFGHHHGDELLRLVTPRLRLALRSDDVLARIGGDEFAVVLEGAGAEAAGRVAERLQTGLRRPFRLAGREITSEASVGIALFPDDADDADELLKRADLAMYDAKAAGTGYRFFRPDRHRTARERLETVDRLRRAIAEHELVLHYQPQASLVDGSVVGVEALVRWQHPSEGLLAPQRFLPQAESGGLMRVLSLEVLELAIRQSAVWRGSGRAVSMSVNLSVSNLLDPELPAQTAELLERNGVPGDALVVELTEDLFMADPERGGHVIRGLLETGVTIAVDDYGTGFSSLGYLRDLRDIGQLKLDRSFVSGLDADPRGQAIVGSTIALARSLGLDLVAEGVETPAERDMLRSLGCTTAQGFLFARPSPADEVVLDPIAAARGG